MDEFTTPEEIEGLTDARALELVAAMATNDAARLLAFMIERRWHPPRAGLACLKVVTAVLCNGALSAEDRDLLLRLFETHLQAARAGRGAPQFSPQP